MSRSVLISEKADQELREACAWWAKHRSVQEAERWYQKFVDKLLALSDGAEEFAAAQESHAFLSHVYQLNFGLTSKLTHRALYIIREDEVVILRIRHLAQRSLMEHELFEE